MQKKSITLFICFPNWYALLYHPLVVFMWYETHLSGKNKTALIAIVWQAVTTLCLNMMKITWWLLLSCLDPSHPFSKLPLENTMKCNFYTYTLTLHQVVHGADARSSECSGEDQQLLQFLSGDSHHCKLQLHTGNIQANKHIMYLLVDDGLSCLIRVGWHGQNQKPYFWPNPSILRLQQYCREDYWCFQNIFIYTMRFLIDNHQ